MATSAAWWGGRYHERERERERESNPCSLCIAMSEVTVGLFTHLSECVCSFIIHFCKLMLFVWAGIPVMQVCKSSLTNVENVLHCYSISSIIKAYDYHTAKVMTRHCYHKALNSIIIRKTTIIFMDMLLLVALSLDSQIFSAYNIEKLGIEALE